MTDGGLAVGSNDDSQRKERRDKNRGGRRDREEWEKEGGKLLRQLEAGTEEHAAVCGILIAFAASTFRLKIRLNER